MCNAIITFVPRAFIFTLLVVGCSPADAIAQESSADGSARSQEQPPTLQLTDTSSPRATLETFIDSCNEFYQITKADSRLERDLPFIDQQHQLPRYISKFGKIIIPHLPLRW